MKKFLVLVLSAVMITTVLAGCSSKKGEPEKESGNIIQSEEEGTGSATSATDAKPSKME
ncbi:MAG: hypothetical protein E6176_00890 [Clostridium celatum]|nr:hypothetical protein [Clostridium celatum]